MQKQLVPKMPKDLQFVYKFENLPHLGVLLALKSERLDEETLWEFVWDAWRDDEDGGVWVLTESAQA